MGPETNTARAAMRAAPRAGRAASRPSRSRCGRPDRRRRRASTAGTRWRRHSRTRNAPCARSRRPKTPRASRKGWRCRSPEIVAIAARLSPDAVHQGLLVEADPLPRPHLEDLEAAGTVWCRPDDPHNVGADACAPPRRSPSRPWITTARHSPEATACSPSPPPARSISSRSSRSESRARARRAEGARLPHRRARQRRRERSQPKRAARAARAGARRRGRGCCASSPRRPAISARTDMPGAIERPERVNAAAVALYAAAAALKAQR